MFSYHCQIDKYYFKNDEKFGFSIIGDITIFHFLFKKHIG